MSLPTNFFIGRGGKSLGPVQQYIIYMQGAGGGSSFQNDNGEIVNTAGGPGGFSSFSLYMPSNAEATIKVGSGGTAASVSTGGGFPDGGNSNGYSTNTQVGTGGGSSSIRIPELDVIWYVGGGGGSGWGDIGGHGGGIDRNGSAGIDVHYTNGGSGSLIDSNWNAGDGGSTTAGGQAGGTYGGNTSSPGNAGTLNAGANSLSGSFGYPGGAGGGGWYGGGSGGANNGAGGGAGGGGSGYYTSGSLVTGLNYLIRSNPTVNIFGNSYSYSSGISNYNTVFGSVASRPAPFGSSNNPYDTGDYGYGGISDGTNHQGKPGQVVVLNFTTNTVIFNQVGPHTSTVRLN